MEVAIEFPLNLQSSQYKIKKQGRKLQFQNYYPKNQCQDDDLVKQNNENQVREVEQYYNSKMQSDIKNFLQEEKETINVLPKNPNIDLKRFLSKKMDKLNKRTDKAIISLLRKKFKPEQEELDKIKQEEIQKQEELAKNQKKKYNPVYDHSIKFDNEIMDDEYEEEEDQDLKEGKLNSGDGKLILQEIQASFNIFDNNKYLPSNDDEQDDENDI